MPTRDPTAWMWTEACHLMEQAERLHRQFFRLAAPEQSQVVWEPPVDVFEDEHEVVVVVAMPGVAADRVQVEQTGEALVVRGRRPLPLSSGRHRVRALEIPHGAFERRIPLPPGLDIGRPEVVDGCLVVRLRKRGE